MRYWIILLMIAFAIPLLPITRSSLRSTSSALGRFIPALSNSTILHPSQRNIIPSSIRTISDQSSNMATSPIPASDPLATSKVVEPVVEEKLPKLSAAEFRMYNKQAEMMQYYHNHFRQTWQTLYKACETNTRPKNLSLNQFFNIGLQLISHLTVHHNIEETHIFPVLAQRMPEFAQSVKDNPSYASNPTARLMTLQHKQIHAGLDRLETYLSECKDGTRDFRLQGDGSLKEVMDSFGAVLWVHLDEEVRLLGAENMRRYWTKEEIGGWRW